MTTPVKCLSRVVAWGFLLVQLAPISVAQISPDVLAQTKAWLLVNCEQGETTGLPPILLSNPADAANALILALENGPDADVVSSVSAAAETSYDALQASLAAGDPSGLNTADTASLASESLAAYTADEVFRFVQGYKGRAISGLALLNAQTAIGVLTPIANDSTSSLQQEAQSALQSFGDLNSDGKTDCADLAIVRAAFGKSIGQLGFDVRADVNGDGVVNVIDLSYVAQRLPAGTTCP